MSDSEKIHNLKRIADLMSDLILEAMVANAAKESLRKDYTRDCLLALSEWESQK